MPRIYCSTRLSQHATLDLPADAAKHCQVLRLQPQDHFTLFDGFGGEYQARVIEMGRQSVCVEVQNFDPIERENKHQVHLIVGMPANERMDWLVEKATELGVHRITPVMTSRSVLRLSGERAQKKQLHWRGIALGACAQSARNTIPLIDAPLSLEAWCASLGETPKDTTLSKRSLNPLTETLPDHLASTAPRREETPENLPVLKKMLSTRLLESSGAHHCDTFGPTTALASAHAIQVVSGPEGGLTEAEELALQSLGFEPSSLGPRVLRAETASLVALTLWGNA